MYRIMKYLSCVSCDDEETLHCETADGGIRCEVCGNDNEYFLTRDRVVLRAD